MENWDLTFGKRILGKIKKNGFLSGVVKGERGSGKSMYCLKIMAYVFYCLNGGDEAKAWRSALDCMIFTPDQLIQLVEHNLDKDVVSPIICIDDATVHFNSYLYFINLYETNLLNNLFDTLRISTNALLINCPDKNRLLSSLRHYDDYEIAIYGDAGGGYQRKAVGIKWYSLPDGHRKYRKAFEDYFSCYVRDDVYNEYLPIRAKYLSDVSKELKRMRTKINKRKQEERKLDDF